MLNVPAILQLDLTIRVIFRTLPAILQFVYPKRLERYGYRAFLQNLTALLQVNCSKLIFLPNETALLHLHLFKPAPLPSKP